MQKFKLFAILAVIVGGIAAGCSGGGEAEKPAETGGGAGTEKPAEGGAATQ